MYKFKGIEFVTFENEAGKHSFYMSPQKWIKELENLQNEINGKNILKIKDSRLYRNVERNDDNVDTNLERNVERKIKRKYPELSNISINILNLLEKNKYLKQNEIAEKLNKAPNTIYRNIKVLKDMGIIERVGSTKKGYWRINF